MVLDEGQKIRNPKARITHLCKRLRTRRRVLLSGTPVQNSLAELWSLFDFTNPGVLGTLEAFEAELAAPIRAGGYAGASPAKVQLGYRCAVALRDLIRPFLLRRTKAAVCAAGTAALPPKTERVLQCRLSADQLSLYQQVLDSDDVKRALADRRHTSAFRAIANLRKICNHPDLYAGAPDDGSPGDSSRSGKLAALDAVLQGWREGGHRALVFSQSVKMLDIVEALVRARGWRYARIDGSTAPAARQALADEFNSPESRAFCMLLTTRTGGVGMSLIGADRVVLYDPDWNPQTDAQARERAWRLGQTRPVTVYRFVCAGTIEEKIYHRQIFKQALTNKVLTDPRQRRLFTQSELAELFVLGSAAYGGGTDLADDAAKEEEEDDDDDREGKLLTALWESDESRIATVFSHDDASNSQPELGRAAEREARRAVRALTNERPPSGPTSSADILALVARRDQDEARADDLDAPPRGGDDDDDDDDRDASRDH